MTSYKSHTLTYAYLLYATGMSQVKKQVRLVQSVRLNCHDSAGCQPVTSFTIITTTL